MTANCSIFSLGILAASCTSLEKRSVCALCRPEISFSASLVDRGTGVDEAFEMCAVFET